MQLTRWYILIDKLTIQYILKVSRLIHQIRQR